jgi:hypothetical protein
LAGAQFDSRPGAGAPVTDRPEPTPVARTAQAGAEPASAETDRAVDSEARRSRLRVVGDADVVADPAPDVEVEPDSPDPTDARAAAPDRAGSNDDEAGDQGDADDEPAEWAWATGLPLAAFAAVLAGVAIWVLSAGLADRPLLAVVLNLVVAGGLVPAMWLSRNLPVLRWFAAGAAVGVVGGWIAALLVQ